ncbi:MAG: replicative helicase loader/inhibitor [bacterium]
MTKSEAARLLAVIAETWRGFGVSETKTAVWAEMLSDIPLEVALRAVKYLIACGSSFPPAISEVRRAIVEMNSPAEYQISALQSWHEAKMVTQNYIEEEGMDKLSPLTREVVRALGWDTVRDGDPDVVRGHFLKFFQMAKERWLKEQMLPADMRPQNYQLPNPPPQKHKDYPPPNPEGRKNLADMILALTQRLKGES